MSTVFASKMDTRGLGIYLVVILCLGSLCHGQFTVRPENYVAIRDTAISLTCQTDASTNVRNIFWQRSDGTDNFELVADDGVIDPVYVGRYTVDYEARYNLGDTSRSVLTITGVLPTDAGTFYCRHVGGDTYSQLVVLDSDPQTGSNKTMNDVVEGEGFGLSCFVGFTSGIGWTPSMTWREADDGDLTSIDQSTANEARFLYAIAANRNQNLNQYQCMTNFPQVPEDNIPQEIRDNHNMDPPTYSVSSDAIELIVNFPVENLVLDNEKSIYYPGEILTMTADSRPVPSYLWQNIVDNTTLTTNILSITVSMEGTQNWTYMAYNTIRGVTYEERRSIDFLVQIPTTTTTTPSPTTPRPTPTEGQTVKFKVGHQHGPEGGLSAGEIAGIVIGCILGLALLLLLIFCCISRNKAPKTMKEKNQKANHVDAVRPPPPQMVRQPDDIAYIDKEKGPPPYNPYAPPSIKTDEGLVYADMAFEDKPRSRKPIQVYETTDYGDLL